MPQPLPNNNGEARAVLAAHVGQLRGLGYDDLRRVMGKVTRSYLGGRLQFVDGSHDGTYEAVGPSGVRYQLNTEVFWDGADGGDIRVMVELQEAAAPYGELVDDFIVAPDGSFVGE